MTRLYKGIEIPDDDEARVEAVRSYEILETPPEQEFDDLTELAAMITGSPVAYISIFDDARSWLKSSYGLPPNRPPRPRELSMCAPTICQDDLLIVPDMTAAPRYAKLPAVANPPHARFYCAMPLINRDGFALGTICVWDTELKELDAGQQDAMRRLARLTVDKLEMRRDLIALRREHQDANHIVQRSRVGMERAEAVVHQLLPPAAAVRLLAGADVEPRAFRDVTALSVGIDNFVNRAGAMDPADLVATLNGLFTRFDRIAAEFGLETIGIAGGTWLGAAGVRRKASDHARRACRAALTIAADLAAEGERCWSIRIGLHSGPAVAGIAGGARLFYDFWGEAPGLAMRARNAGAIGKVTITDATLGLAGAAFEALEAGDMADTTGGRVPLFEITGEA